MTNTQAVVTERELESMDFSPLYTCAYMPCNCPVEDRNDFCCVACQEMKDTDTPLDCLCAHMECTGAVTMPADSGVPHVV